MKLLIQFPTRSRPAKFFEVLKMYKDFADNWDDIQVHVVCGEDDEKMNNETIKNRFLHYPGLFITYTKLPDKISACNFGISQRISDWTIALLASDDMLPKIKGYDTRIIEDMKKFFPDTDGVLWYNDGHKGDKLCTLSILGRKYFDRFGYIYYPEYKSFWCDNEFAEVATKLNKIQYSSDCIIEHAHPDFGLCKTDEQYKFNLRTYYTQDKGLYLRRKALGFPK